MPRMRDGYFLEDPGQGWKEDWKPGPAGYIQPEIPHLDVPVYRGERYEAMVPDTFDLAERVRLAIHGMTENTAPELDHGDTRNETSSSAGRAESGVSGYRKVTF